ncbi:MAG: divergent PAP2 family protein [Patescibacteria group bacterium]
MTSIRILLAPFITLVIVQSIKLAADGIKGNFTLRGLFFTYGGMPSSHTAFVTSMTTMVGWSEGVTSSDFAVAVVLSLIVIVDAVILRRYIDGHGQAVTKLVARLPADEQRGYPAIATKIEHTMPQVLVGALIGFAISTIIFFLL